MRLTVPITGTVLVEGSLDELVGDENDPISLIPIDLGNVSWTLIDIDLENEVAIIEVVASEIVSEPTGNKITLPSGNIVNEYINRPTTETEKMQALRYAQDLIYGKTKDELYETTGAARLKRPFKPTEE